MTQFASTFKRLAASAALVTIAAGAAHAQDVEGALDRLQALSAEQGLTLEWSDVAISGDDAELLDVRAGDGERTVPIGTVSLTGISQTDTGYRIETMALPRYEAGDEEGTLIVDNVVMNGVALPREGEEGPLGGLMFYDSVSVEQARAEIEGAEIFSMTDLRFTLSPPDNGEPMRFNGGARNMTIDLTAMGTTDAYPMATALGYDRLSGSFAMDGSWNLEDGRLELAQYDLTMTDAGTLGLTFTIEGYTPDFIEAMRQVQQRMADNPESSGNAMAMLGLAQQLGLQGAEISFRDDGLTNNVINYIAQDQGVRPSDIVNQTKAVLPFMLAQLNSRELTTMVNEAVSDFLDDPQVLRVTADPGRNVPFALIMAGAMASPEGLIETLGLTITANE